MRWARTFQFFLDDRELDKSIAVLILYSLLLHRLELRLEFSELSVPVWTQRLLFSSAGVIQKL